MIGNLGPGGRPGPERLSGATKRNKNTAPGRQKAAKRGAQRGGSRWVGPAPPEVEGNHRYSGPPLVLAGGLRNKQSLPPQLYPVDARRGERRKDPQGRLTRCCTESCGSFRWGGAPRLVGEQGQGWTEFVSHGWPAGSTSVGGRGGKILGS